jgi:hypothetical protein
MHPYLCTQVLCFVLIHDHCQPHLVQGIMGGFTWDTALLCQFGSLHSNLPALHSQQLDGCTATAGPNARRCRSEISTPGKELHCVWCAD